MAGRWREVARGALLVVRGADTTRSPVVPRLGPPSVGRTNPREGEPEKARVARVPLVVDHVKERITRETSNGCVEGL